MCTRVLSHYKIQIRVRVRVVKSLEPVLEYNYNKATKLFSQIDNNAYVFESICSESLVYFILLNHCNLVFPAEIFIFLRTFFLIL